MNNLSYSNLSWNDEAVLPPQSQKPQAYAVAVTFSLIFVCSVLSNVLVIVGVWRNSSLRSNMNLLLINLSLANLLFALVVIPCTVVSYWRSSFMFGAAFCVIYNYTQGVSVGLSAFTLTVLSLERYYAICKPLTSFRRQTTKHCYKMITMTWFLALLVAMPSAIMSKLEEHPNGVWKKCRENWSSRGLKHLELAYTLFLDVVLFGIPLMVMIVAYIFIGLEMSKNIPMELTESARSPVAVSGGHTIAETDACDEFRTATNSPKYFLHATVRTTISTTCTLLNAELQNMASCFHQASKVRQNRRRKVIRLIVIVVLEFFICWSPVYALQTWMSINEQSARQHISSTMNLALRILAYASTFVYPFTYCFMNENFRRALCKCVVRSCRKSEKHRNFERLFIR